MDKRYSIIYPDPPWGQNKRSGAGTRFGSGIHAHYEGMTTQAIMALPVAALCADRAVCLMWATGPKLPDALAVMKAWGFRYSTIAFTWVKMVAPRHVRVWKGQKLTHPVLAEAPKAWAGPGNYTRSNVELVLLGVKGQPLPVASQSVHQVIMLPQEREMRTNAQGRRYSAIVHSRKPPVVRQRIVELFGDLPRVELFARERAAGWDAIGDQLLVDPVKLRAGDIGR